MQDRLVGSEAGEGEVTLTGGSTCPCLSRRATDGRLCAGCLGKVVSVGRCSLCTSVVSPRLQDLMEGSLLLPGGWGQACKVRYLSNWC
jgi:hypothetical protein